MREDPNIKPVKKTKVLKTDTMHEHVQSKGDATKTS